MKVGFAVGTPPQNCWCWVSGCATGSSTSISADFAVISLGIFEDEYKDHKFKGSGSDDKDVGVMAIKLLVDFWLLKFGRV